MAHGRAARVRLGRLEDTQRLRLGQPVDDRVVPAARPAVRGGGARVGGRALREARRLNVRLGRGVDVVEHARGVLGKLPPPRSNRKQSEAIISE